MFFCLIDLSLSVFFVEKVFFFVSTAGMWVRQSQMWMDDEDNVHADDY